MIDTYDKISNLKHINERNQIIQRYQLTGYLNREEAISKILELRSKDKEVLSVTEARLKVSSTPFSEATDQAIIAELKMQVDILTAKLQRTQVYVDNVHALLRTIRLKYRM